MSKRHQVNRRRSYGRRQHEIHERGDRRDRSHGVAGWKTAFPEIYSVPKLGGQKAAYIVAALKAYKKGERDMATMKAIALDLSDQDMEDLAAYYAQTPAKSASSK